MKFKTMEERLISFQAFIQQDSNSIILQE